MSYSIRFDSIRWLRWISTYSLVSDASDASEIDLLKKVQLPAKRDDGLIVEPRTVRKAEFLTSAEVAVSVGRRQWQAPVVHWLRRARYLARSLRCTYA